MDGGRWPLGRFLNCTNHLSRVLCLGEVVDDCSVLYGGSNIDELNSRLQRVLDNLVDWGHSCNLSFNHEKSVAMFFTSTTLETCDTYIRIDGNDLF